MKTTRKGRKRIMSTGRKRKRKRKREKREKGMMRVTEKR